MWQKGVWGEGEKMLLEMESRDVKQDLIPNERQLEFPNVPVKGWIIDPDVHGFLGSHNGVVCLPAHYGEIVHTKCNAQRYLPCS